MKVLIAEDDNHIRDGLAAILADEGYETIAAVDGRDALARFRPKRRTSCCSTS